MTTVLTAVLTCRENPNRGRCADMSHAEALRAATSEAAAALGLEAEAGMLAEVWLLMASGGF